MDNRNSGTVFGLFLQAIGVLLMAVSGLCTGLVVYSVIFGKMQSNPQKDLPGVFLIGGIPFAIGWGLFKLGGRKTK